jgi:lipoprotein-releasing system permease protein
MSDPALLLLFAVRLLMKARFTLVLLVLAVAFGVGFQIPNNANLAGYSRELLAQGMRRATGHVTVTSPSADWDDAGSVVAKLEALPCVKHVATRLVQAAVVLREGAPMPVRFVGVDLEREKRATDLCARVAKGACIRVPAEEVLVGSEAAQVAHLEAGQPINLAVAAADGKTMRKLSLRIAGILRGGGAFQEDRDLIAAREALLDPLDDLGQVSSILVYGKDAEQSDAYRDAIRTALPDLTVRSWRDASGFVAHAIEGNQTIAVVSQMMVMIAVLVPVLALSYIHVNSERKQVGVLRAIGMTRVDILLIYLLKTVIIALLGSFAGAALGLLVCHYFQAHPVFNSGGFLVLPYLSSKAVLSSMSSVALTTVLAGLWPALRAASMSPIEELAAA